MRTVFVVLITIVIVTIIYLLLEGGALYYGYRKTRKEFLALQNTVYNSKECPVDVEKGIYTCPYKNIDLTPPDLSNIHSLSFYTANLVGKLENGYKLPLPVLKEVGYNGKKFGTVLDGGNLQGVQILYVVYRGTKTWEEWKKDFSYYQKSGELPVENNKSGAQQSALLVGSGMQALQKDGEPVLIHQGFLDIYNSFKKEIMDTVAKYPKKQIIVTGHSLGSAVAVITALNMALAGLSVSSIVFASPRVGNQAFANMVNNKGFHTQWINTADLIPTMPYPVSPNFIDKDSPFIYTHAGKLNFFTINKKSLTNNHTISTYIEHISKLRKTLK